MCKQFPSLFKRDINDRHKRKIIKNSNFDWNRIHISCLTIADPREYNFFRFRKKGRRVETKVKTPTSVIDFFNVKN